MKHLNRFLAILLAVLMLCGMFSAVAEMEVTLDAPQDIENIELDTDDAPDVSLDLDDLNSLDLEDPALVSEAPEAAIVSNAGEQDTVVRPVRAVNSLTGQAIDEGTIKTFIEGLCVSDSVKEELRAITPHTYTGIS